VLGGFAGPGGKLATQAFDDDFVFDRLAGWIEGPFGVGGCSGQSSDVPGLKGPYVNYADE
jgi:hypothetical protein